MTKDNFTQKEIYQRMLLTAAEVWNVKESALKSLDPVVKLMMNALAKEMEGVANEMRSAETRMLKRLARQLLPHELQSVMPAHTVLHFTPPEKIHLSGYEGFVYEKRWYNKEKFNRLDTRDITFTPALQTILQPTRLKYRLQKDRVVEIDGTRQVMLDFSPPVGNNLEIILGFEGLQPGNLTLYVDWIAEAEKRKLYQNLDKIRTTTITGSLVRNSLGLPVRDAQHNSIYQSLDVQKQVESAVVHYYNHRFIHLRTEALLSEKTELPPKDKELFEALDPDGSIHWLVLHFPKEMEDRLVQDCFIQINCFPALNRRLERQVVRLQPELNIKKLSFEGAFLSIERIESDEGAIYTEIKGVVRELSNPGTYALRRGGLGRLDAREATEYLVHMLDLIKEEKQAFAALDSSGTTEDLRKIAQALARIERNVERDGLRNTRPFLILVPFKDFENAHIYFWSTDASFANGIVIESELNCTIAGLSSSGSAVVVTDVVGGEDELPDAMLINRYRNALLTKNVLVTKADIESHCAMLAEGMVAQFQIDREVIASEQAHTGLMEVLKVKIAFKESFTDIKRREYLLQKMESDIVARSNFSIPVKVQQI